MIDWCKRRQFRGRTRKNEKVLRFTNIHTRDRRKQIPQQERNSYSSRDIIDVAGELDDRWLRNEESGLKPGTTRARREESPDTALRQQRMGNAPGNARGAMISSHRKVIAVCGSRKVPQKINRRES